MKKVFIALAAVLAITAGCAKEEFKSVLFGETAKECPVKTITAAIENSDSKASLNFDGELPQICWEEGDEVAVFGRTPAKASDTIGRANFVLSGGEGTPEGEFEYVEGDLSASNIYYAVYPYGVTTKNSVTTSSLTNDVNDKITVEFPSKEKFNTSTLCAEGANIMVAKFKQTDTTDTPKFYFMNLCSYIEFYVDGPAEDKLQSAVIRSKDGSAINGIATCKFSSNGDVSVEFDGKGTDAIVVTFYDSETQQEGIDFSSEPIDIALPPVINNGFTITLVSVNGIETTVSSDAVLGRNTVTRFADPIVLDPATVKSAAKVADTEYPSFKAALAAANEMGEDCTIQLLRDCNITSVAEVSNANAVITLDLNGKTLTSVDINRINVLAESKGFVIEDNSTEQTGTIKQENAGGNAVLSYGHLTVNSGTIIGGLAAIYVYNGVLEVNGGTFKGDATTTGVITVNSSSDTQFAVDSVALRGGLVEASARGLYFKGGCRNITFYDGFSVQAGKVPVYNTDCCITFNGGEFHSDSTNPVSDRTSGGGMFIHGGFFSTENSVAVVYGTKDQTFVDGGYFNRNPSKDYIAAGYTAQGCDTTYNGRNYTFKVVQEASQQALLTIEGEEGEIYSDGTKALQDAVAAGKPCEVKLLSSFTMNGLMALAEGASTIVIDLNGYTLNTNGKNFRINVDGGHLIIRSTGENAASGTLACLPADSYSLYQTNGHVTIESGKFTGSEDNQYYSVYTKSGHIDITGGEFYCDFYQAFRVGGDGVQPGDAVANIKNAKFTSAGHTKKYKSPGESTASVKDTLNEALYFTTGAVATVDNVDADCICSYGNSNVVITNSRTKKIMKINPGEMTVESGTFANDSIEARSATSIIHINGGNFEGSGHPAAVACGAGTINITGGTFSTTGSYAALKTLNATVNIDGGTFTATNKFGTIWSYNGGGITINDATVVSGKAEGQQTRALYIGDGNDSAKSKGKIIINGGKYTADNTLARVYGGNFTVNGGTFTAQDTIFHCGGIGNTNTVVVDGYFNSKNSECEMFIGSDLNGSISGGHYNRTFNTDYITAGKALVEKPVTVEGVTYQYAVEDDITAPDLLTVNGTPYKSFDAAFKAAEGLTSVDIKLLEGGKCSPVTFNDKQDVTIDFNGKVLSTTVVSTAKTLALSDSSVEGTGGLEGTKSLVALTVNEGTVTMTGGTITGSSNGGVYLNGPKGAKSASTPVFNMSGGKIVSDAKPASLGGSTGTYASLSIIDGGVFNLSGGEIENTAKSSTALYIRASSTDKETFPEFNMTGGKLTGRHYAFYPYSQAQINISGGQVTTQYRISHNGTSNALVSINFTGGYFSATGYEEGRIISGYNDVSVKAFHISGGYWNDDPIENGKKAYSTQPLKLEDGYTVVKLETPVVIGDLTYNYQIVAK